MVKVKRHQACRYYDLVMNKAEKDKHHELTMGYIDNHFLSPSGGSSGPNFDDNLRLIEGEFRLVFFLNEAVCDEYEKAMGIVAKCEKMRKTYNGR